MMVYNKNLYFFDIVSLEEMCSLSTSHYPGYFNVPNLFEIGTKYFEEVRNPFSLLSPLGEGQT